VQLLLRLALTQYGAQASSVGSTLSKVVACRAELDDVAAKYASVHAQLQQSKSERTTLSQELAAVKSNAAQLQARASGADAALAAMEPLFGAGSALSAAFTNAQVCCAALRLPHAQRRSKRRRVYRAMLAVV
jgi:septal ring factor EnvC (AmiA/AmiB activator)